MSATIAAPHFLEIDHSPSLAVSKEDEEGSKLLQDE